MRERDEVGDDGDGGGIAARSMAGEDNVATVLAADEHHVFGTAGPGEGRAQRHEHGTDGRGDSIGAELGFRNLTDGAVEVARVDEVDGVDFGDGAAAHRFDVNVGAQGDAGEDDELRAGVVAVDVFAGVG